MILFMYQNHTPFQQLDLRPATNLRHFMNNSGQITVSRKISARVLQLGTSKALIGIIQEHCSENSIIVQDLSAAW
jgi:hypothetical protein